MAISDVVATVAKARAFKSATELGGGTSCWYTLNDDLFLITNRHVVINEAENYFPDELRLLLHIDPNDIRRNADFAIPLYSNGKPQWREHPIGGPDVDVVALPVDKTKVQPQFFVKALNPENHIPNNVDVSIGADVQVIGYPLGFHDDIHNLPIVRNATIASVYPVPFQGHPYVLIDSRLHRGTSGSPVMTKPTTMVSYTDGSTGMHNAPVSFFMGIHSATLDIKGRDANIDEPLGLNIVWFAGLIPEIITQNAA